LPNLKNYKHGNLAYVAHLDYIAYNIYSTLTDFFEEKYKLELVPSINL